MAKEIESMIPVDPIRRLRKQLAKAVRDERYEEAASLRDQIDRLSSRRRDK
jgi:protein-arginine kinase activator protein McsA